MKYTKLTGGISLNVIIIPLLWENVKKNQTVDLKHTVLELICKRISLKEEVEDFSISSSFPIPMLTLNATYQPVSSSPTVHKVSLVSMPLSLLVYQTVFFISF